MSIILMFSLLSVTSLPNVVVTSACAVPQDVGMNMAQSSVMHHHAAVLANDDWQTSRIECGCGCHRQLDCMPHVLSPHLIPLIAQPSLAQSLWSRFRCSNQPLVRTILGIPLPPPIIL